MNDLSRLYENAGELTRGCLDEIIDGEHRFIDDDENYTEEYLLEYKFKTFAEGLTECIVKNGFTGDADSVEERTAYVKARCRENNISLNPSVVKTWFTEKRPASSKSSRELVYKLCFALGLDAEKTTDFFLRVYYECPFNFRLHNELIYYYCLKNGRSYSEALSLTEKAEKFLRNSVSDEAAYEFTTAIGSAIRNIRTDDELLEFISGNSREFHTDTGSRTAYRYASQLINECTILAAKSCENSDELHHKLRRKGNIDLFISILFGEDFLSWKNTGSFSKTSKFPELIKDNFPLKMNLSKIKNGSPVSYDTMRKALIMLSFYSFFAKLFQGKDDLFCALEGDFTDFICETNDLLYSCGYPTLYVRNPYDWLFMHCAYCEFPLVEFKNAAARYFLDSL